MIGALSGATSPGQSGPGSDGNERVLHIPQSSSITGTDCLVSYPGHLLRGLTPLQRSSRCILQPQPNGKKLFWDLRIITVILNQLLKKNLEWGRPFEYQNAPEEVIKALTPDLSFAHFDPNKKIYVAIDASNLGLGAILSHKEDNGLMKAVALGSRMLLRAEKI